MLRSSLVRLIFCLVGILLGLALCLVTKVLCLILCLVGVLLPLVPTLLGLVGVLFSLVLGLFKLVLTADRGTAIIYETYKLAKVCLEAPYMAARYILTALDHSAVRCMLAKSVAVCNNNQQCNITSTLHNLS